MRRLGEKMKTLHVLLISISLLASGFGCCAKPRASLETDALINKLTEISEIGYGYSAMFSGSQFLPHSDSEELHCLVLGSQESTKSLILDKIVRQGINAVPSLLKHLDDSRKTQIPAVRGMMWISFDNYLKNGDTESHQYFTFS